MMSLSMASISRKSSNEVPGDSPIRLRLLFAGLKGVFMGLAWGGKMLWGRVMGVTLACRRYGPKFHGDSFYNIQLCLFVYSEFRQMGAHLTDYRCQGRKNKWRVKR